MPSSTKKKRKKKGVSGNPAKQVSSVQDWKQRSTSVKVPLPSGQVCLANRIGMRAFLEKGTIPDKLTPIVQGMIREKQFLPPEKQRELANDMQVVLETQEMLDRALVLTVVEPKVHMPPGCEVCGKYLNYNDEDKHNRKGDKFDHEFVQEERNEDLLYTDDVDLADKLFLFQWSVGGGTDLESFRQRWQESLAVVAGVEGSGSDA